MSESIELILLALGWVAVFTVLGLGPAWALGRRLGSPIILAPVLGVALGAAFFTTSALFISMRVAVLAILVPMLLGSLAWFAIVVMRDGAGFRALRGSREIGLPAALSGLALVVASLPHLLVGSLGPMTWVLRDAWWYLQTGDWLQEHNARELPNADGYVSDLLGSSAALVLDHGGRTGVTALYAVGSALFGVEPDRTFASFLVAVFALLPASVWIVARRLGIGRIGASVAGLVCVPLGLGLVVDSALANLTALILVPVLLMSVVEIATSGSWCVAILAGVLAAGLVSAYPELVPFTVAALVVAAVVGAVALRRSGMPIRPRVAPLAARIGLGVGVLVVLAPYGVVKLADYLEGVTGAAPPTSAVDRGLSTENTWSWLFGLRHIYELEFHSPVPLGDFGSLMAAVLPLVLFAVIIIGVFFGRNRASRVAVVLGPVVVAIVLGYYAFRTGATGDTCQYCLGKGLSLAVPFLAIGLGAGVGASIHLMRREDGRRGLGVVAAASILAVSVGLAGMAFQAQRVINDYRYQAAYPPNQARHLLRPGGPLPTDASVWMEGIEDTGDAVSFLPGLYTLVKDAPARVPYYDAEWNYLPSLYLSSQVAFYGKAAPFDRYADPGYRWVFTTWSGLDSHRKRVGRSGRYAIERRAPIDVIVGRTNEVIGGPDRRAADAARPTIRGAIELWVSSPRATSGYVAFETDQPIADRLTVRVGDRSLTPIWGDGARKLCVDVDLFRGFTPVHFESPNPSDSGVELTRVRAESGSCQEVTSRWAPPAFISSGAYPREPLWFDGAGGRWLRTNSTIEVGTAGTERPATRLTLRAAGFVRPRTVTATIGEQVVGSVIAPPDPRDAAELSILVPAGVGIVTIRLRVTPGEQSAAITNPADDRLLAVLVSDLSAESG